MLKRKDYEYLNDNDYSLAGEQLYKNANSFLTAESIVNAAYLTSNEQLDKYFPMIGVVDKKIATVGSSGDQILNALFYGCKDITLIDGNILSEAYIEYKMALIKTLEFSEFRKLVLEDGGLFNWKIYSRISHNLHGSVRQFFDEFISMQEDYSKEKPLSYQKFSSYDFYTSIINNLPHTEFSEFYHYKVDYDKLKKILNQGDYKISYIVSRFEDFSKRLPEKYDVIFLSNIYDYVNRLKFSIELNNIYKQNLNAGGVVQFQYYFDDSPFKKLPRFYNPKKVQIITLPAKVSYKCGQSDRCKCKVYLLKKPNSKELELGMN